MRRAKNLSDEDITKIVGILDGWSGKLTWDLLIEAVERHLFARYTRQALHKHPRIQDAFELRKKALSADSDRPQKLASTPEMQAALEKIERLEAQVQRIEAENNRLLEQFARWAYNANMRGLEEAFLNSPLPDVNRR
ncbi:hypothetical protein [Comamonas jiangduensis]|uniref:hypothetical protein n=1 Tax=Comamonas jiangduensis TaxID=1194168 RepID=UPI001583CF4C|nr:hypothetical protein [Comamonas jiangduensis]